VRCDGGYNGGGGRYDVTACVYDIGCRRDVTADANGVSRLLLLCLKIKVALSHGRREVMM